MKKKIIIICIISIVILGTGIGVRELFFYDSPRDQIAHCSQNANIRIVSYHNLRVRVTRPLNPIGIRSLTATDWTRNAGSQRMDHGVTFRQTIRNLQRQGYSCSRVN